MGRSRTAYHRGMGTGTITATGRKRIVIVGAGFGGVECAKALKGVDADVVVIDKRNHFTFQPLLYQVATASLSPAEIAHPIRQVLRGTGCRVVMGRVAGVDLDRKCIRIGEGSLSYDTLVLAAGATHAYFGHEEWAPLAPGLKTVDDATELRRRLLLAFESAEYEADDDARRACLTFAIVGGGPTGVELAGAIKEVAAKTLQKDYQNIDTGTTRVILIQGGDRLLKGFPEELSARAKRDLERMGVDVRLGTYAQDVTEGGVRLGDEFVSARNVFWAAGVKASKVTASLPEGLTDASGRIDVGPDLSLPGHPEVFAIGDIASAHSAKTGEPVPGVAQGAMQSGAFVGKLIKRELQGRSTVEHRPAFSYADKGQMAVIGRSKAVAQLGPFKLGGFVAWLAWSVIHIVFLVGYRNRMKVLISWGWNWLINSRDALLITGDVRATIKRVEAPGYERDEPEQQPAEAGSA